MAGIVVALLLAYTPAAAPVQAQAESDLPWDTRMAVGTGFGNRGYSELNYGSLGDYTFTHGGTEYLIEDLYVHANGVRLQVSPPLGGNTGLFVQWGDETLPLNSASPFSTDSYTLYHWSRTWVANNAASFREAKYRTTLVTGSDVHVCVRTAGQYCMDDDATLSGLDLADTDAVDVAIDPTFDAETTSYTATVERSVRVVTVTPTANNPRASVEYLDGTDLPLADADTETAGQQVRLGLGNNILKVQVTSADTTETETYTVVVERLAYSTLVTNTFVTPSEVSLEIGNTQNGSVGQRFTTGSHELGYAVTSAMVYLGSVDFSGDETVSVRIHEFDEAATNDLGPLVATMQTNALTAGAVNFFDGPPDTRLEPDTEYVLNFHVTGDDPGDLEVRTANSDQQRGADGWLIEDDRRSGGALDGSGDSILMGVRGYAVQSSDATLSAIEITDSNSASVSLSPTVQSGTFMYNALVAEGVDEVTIVPTTTHDDATVLFLDESDADLTDANSGEDGQQASLAVGETKLKVRVTAADEVTQETYTIVVTRPETLVDNTHLTRTGVIDVGATRNGFRSQRFTTGSNAAGYEVASVGIHIHNESFSRGETVAVRIHEFDDSAFPSTNRQGPLVATLITPRLRDNSVIFFDAPPDTRLEPDTEYIVNFHGTGNNIGDLELGAAGSNDQMGAEGWSIEDAHRQSENTSGSQSIMIHVLGHPFAASDDAKLSGLDLVSGDHYIVLSPEFLPDTTTYTATVDNSVNRITAQPTKSDEGARIEYLDVDEQTLADVAPNVVGHQINLGVGDTTFKMKLTSSDTTETATYTVVVTRLPDSTLVTNTHLTSIGNRDIGQATNGSEGQRFTTGSNTLGYEVTSVGVYVVSEDLSGAEKVTAHIHKFDDSATNDRGALAATLTTPELTENAVNFFTAPISTVLDPSTQYIVNFDSTGDAASDLEVGLVSSDDETGDTGWLIEDARRSNGSTDTDRSMMIELRGFARTSSDDAALSGLALADSGGAAISPVPPPSAGTTTYTARVGLSKDVITVTPTRRNRSATIEYLDESDQALADADTEAAGQQVSLAEGANTFKIRVTSSDTTKIRTHTVIVTRVEESSLVRNPFGRTLGRFVSVGRSVNGFHGQDFTTGRHVAGYEITTVGIFINAANYSDSETVTAHIHEFDEGATNDRGALVATLTTPVLSSGKVFYFFNAPADTVLKPGTRYLLSLDSTGNSDNDLRIGTTTTDAEHGAANWRVGNARRQGGSATSANSMMIEVKGNARPLSDDATLSALDLVDADGNAVALEPAFMSDTILYAATVDNVVDVITVEATEGDLGAMIEYLDRRNQALDDVDTDTVGHQIALQPGATTFRVKVTSSDTTETATYTVVVTRLEDSTLVKNTHLTSIDDLDIGDASGGSAGQRFTVGTDAVAYEVTSVGVYIVDEEYSGAETVTARIHVFADGATNGLGPLAATLTTPTLTDNAVNVFEAPTDSRLTPGIPYILNFDSTGDSPGDLELGLVSSDEEIGAAGWLIEDSRRSGGSTATDRSFMIEVRGHAIPFSDDATLSALDLADSNGIAIPLSPEFEPATTSYTASVDRIIDEITVTLNKGNAFATLAYLDGGGQPLPDADTDAVGHQVSLGMGANTFKVSVTSSDTTETITYTVVVTRLEDSALVKNTHLTRTSRLAMGSSRNGSNGQRFTTGTDVAGYDLTSVGIYVVRAGFSREETVIAHVHRFDDGPTAINNRGEQVATLITPNLTNDAVNVFEVMSPEDEIDKPLLEPGVQYILNFHSTGNLSSDLELGLVSSDDQASPAGWLIEDANRYNGSKSGTSSLMIEVRGTVRTPSDDATLSALELKDLAANTVALNPEFTSDTTSYTATVGADINRITVLPTKSNAGASIEYLDQNDQALSDADTAIDDYQVSLGSGDTTFKVKVTAQDGITTKIYTVVVTKSIAVTVSFGSATYSVEETDDTSTTEDKENEVVVTVTLSDEPAREVEVTIDKENQDGATGDDYSGVPASVSFGATETSKTFTFAATADSVDDDGESVKLSFSGLPAGVTGGTITETVVSINDDDLPADVDVSFEQGTYTVAEGSSVTVKVKLSEEPDRAISIPLTRTNNGDTTDDDYSGVPASLAFGATETEKTFAFAAASDSDNDDGDSVTVSLDTDNFPAGVTNGATVATTVSITDDDVPSVTVSFGSATYSVEESDDTSTTEDKENEVVVTVTLSAEPEREVEVTIDKENQDGASGDDYSGVPASLSFGATETSKTFTFAATADSVDDDGESVKLSFSALPAGVTGGTITETIVSITDDDLPADVDVSFEQAAYTVAEGSSVTVKVKLSEEPDRSVTIPLTRTNNGDTTDDDYSGVPESVTFGATETEKTFAFAAASDSDNDDGDSVTVSLDTDNFPAGVTNGATVATTVSITDDDVPDVTVSFGSATYSVEETDDTSTTEDKENEVVVTVTLSAEPEREVEVTITKANQDGASGDDYSGVPASLSFGATETSKTFTFAATADTEDDDGESVKLSFSGLPAGVTGGTITETVISINDDDLPADVDVSFEQAAYTVAEGSSVTVKVKLSEEPDRSVTIPLTRSNNGDTTDDDYSGVPESVTFGATETEKTFAFAAAADSDNDDGDSVTISLDTDNFPAGVTNGATTATTVSITDDDVPSVTVEFGSATYSVEESDDTSTTEDKENEVVVTVTLSDEPEREVEVTIDKENQDGATGDDYSGVPASLSFGATETSKTFTFAATADSVDDDGESVKLSFSGLPAGVTGGTITETVISINDDDLPDDVDVSFEQGTYTVAEGSSVTVKVKLSEEPDRSVTIPLTRTNNGATTDDDYSGVPGSLVFGATETEKTFAFSATADSVDDDGDSVTISLDTDNFPTGVTNGATVATTVSITDDDVPSVTVEFGSATYSVEESDDTTTTEDKENEVVVTVTLSDEPEREVEVTIDKANQGGTSGDDYSGVPASLSFGATEREKTFTFAATADTEDDDGESVKLSFSGLPAGVTGGTIEETVISINDDDLPADVDVSFEQGTYTVAEGSSVTVTVKLSEEPDRAISIPLTRTNNGATTDDDYSGVPASLAFGATETEKTFAFSATADSVDDDGDSVTISLDTDNFPAGVTNGATVATTVSITDDDVPDVTVSFGSATYSVEESDNTTTTEDKENEVVVTVTLSDEPEREVEVTIDKENQDGASGDDYSGVPASLSFGATEREKTFTFAATADTEDDDGESVKLSFSGLPAGVTGGTIEETVISINDDDLPDDVDVSFEQGTYTVAEGSSVTVTVKLSEEPDRAISIPLTRTNNGATTDDDYSGVPPSLAFGAAETEKTFSFSAASDSDNDDGDSVTISLDTGNFPTGVTGGATTATTVSITDDDVPSVSVSFGSATYSVEESDDTTTTEDKENEVVVTVTLSDEPEREVEVTIDKENQDGATGDDYSGVPASLSFGATETSKTFTFAATADTEDDDGESVKLSFSGLPAGVTEGTIKETVISINDDDLPADVDVSFEQGTYTVAEGSSVTVKVKLSEEPDRAISIPLTRTNNGDTTDDDYSGVPASLAFGATETEKTFSFSAASDTDNDDGDSVTISLDTGNFPTGVTGGATTATTVSITDDDVPSVSVSFGSATYSVEESDDTTTTEDKENEVVVTVTLSDEPEREVEVTIDKENQDGATGDDYSGVPASLSFGATETEKTFTFAATADTEDDDGESVKLSFSGLPAGVTGGTITETVISINDDDLPDDVDVSFEQGTYTVAEGSSVTVKVKLSEEPDRAISIPLTRTNNGDTTDDDYSGVPPSLAFGATETEKTFAFSATADSVDDDGDSVTISLDTDNFPAGVTNGATVATTVSITDDDSQEREPTRVAFSVSTAYVTEGDPDLNLAVKLTPAPRAQVSILITTQGRGGATPSDWSGVPSSVTFNAGEDTKYFKVVVVDDDEPEDRETLRIGLGDLPTGFAAGTPDATLVVLIDNDEQDPASTQCPTDTGKRFVLERVSSISQSDEIDYWRVKLDPLRFYIIEVLGADSGVDVMGEDTHSGDLTLDDPELVAIWNGDRSRRVSRIGSGGRDGGYGRNSMIFPRGDTYDGWHQIEVRGKNGGTGTYQIKVRVSNICTIINGRAAYAFPGGPDGFSLDLPANVATHRGIYLRSGQGTSLGYLGDNSEWYWEREPDEDWMRVKMQSDHEYTFEVSNDTRYAAEYQARSLKIMGIHDDDGNLIPGTSSGSGGQVSVTFRPQTTGTYYLAVGSGSSDRTGFYVASVTRSETE